MTIFSFMSENPILSFFLVLMLLHSCRTVFQLCVRHLNIRASGWPPEHCDADGDFKKEEEDCE